MLFLYISETVKVLTSHLLPFWSYRRLLFKYRHLAF